MTHFSMNLSPGVWRAAGCLAAAFGGLVGSGLPARAMQPAEMPAQFSAGLEGGATGLFTRARLSGAGDLNVGVLQNFGTPGYKAIVVDTLSTANRTSTPTGTVAIRTTLTTLGIRAPVTIPGLPGGAIEAGGAFVNLQATAGSESSAATRVGGFGGARYTSPGDMIRVTGMVRYYFVSAGVWQAGMGLTGPLAANKSLNWQLDYYRTGGGTNFSGGTVNTNSLLVGIRWTK